EANGGSPSTAPTNYPIVIWMPNDGAASVGGALSWTPDSAHWQVPQTPFPGPGLVFVVVNGMRSVALSASVESLEQGEACVSGGQCKSSYCADGVCCKDACAGECMQCSAGGECKQKAN